MEKTPLKNLLGCLPKAIARNLFIGAGALILGIMLGGPKIYISLPAAITTFCLLLVLYIAITWWSIGALARSGQNGALVTSGPYALTRNPMYAGIIFILNPALGILFRSWLLVLAVIPIYFSWRQCVRGEETGALAAKFGQAHLDYMKSTARFFPNLRLVHPILFYGAAGLLIFLASFIFLNSSALYLRWVAWEASGEITYDKPGKINSGFASNVSQPAGQSASYNPGPNAIFISQLNVRAPLVNSAGPSQNEINMALNQGVVLYPGSALPGQAGEVFLTGHSSVFPWNKTEYGQVFTMLDELEAGDTVSLVYNNQQYDYQIIGKEILSPNQVKISATDEPRLALMTCWPIGTALKRLVVYGELIR
ncbi:sortase [Patescibacteria group bacterium]|nr:sortase [Patescibacteria group bacterium]